MIQSTHSWYSFVAQTLSSSEGVRSTEGSSAQRPEAPQSWSLFMLITISPVPPRALQNLDPGDLSWGGGCTARGLELGWRRRAPSAPLPSPAGAHMH